MDQARAGIYSSASVPTGALNALGRRLLFKALAGLRGAWLELHLPEGTRSFGDPASSLRACATIHDPRVFTLAALRGEVGLGEAFVEGYWSSPDPVAVIRLAVRNLAALDGGGGALAWVAKALLRLRHLGRGNSRAGSRRNIAAHYDLGNEFYGLWLDRSMAYSSAFFSRADATLEEAQEAKYARICDRLRLGSGDHLLEIGTGWGGFALYAGRRHGCRITTTTISREQFQYASERIQEAGLADRVTVLLQDYRDLQGSYSKAVSIEMFEAVGLKHYDSFFAAVDRLLEPGGSCLIQTITMNERRFPAYIRSTDWIQQYVFPGAELASVTEIQRSLVRATELSLFFLEDLGAHYGRTLELWRARFNARQDAVRALGFDERFLRLWNHYLASCEGAFRERYIGVVQLLLAKNGTGRALLQEPWGQP